MNKLIIISGPSGAGKGTVVKELLKIYEENKDKVYLSISATTRDIREGEVDGVSYYFIKEEEFLSKIKEGDFLEYNQYGTGKYYGTLKSKVLEHLKTGDVILEIDINGYKQVMNLRLARWIAGAVSVSGKQLRVYVLTHFDDPSIFAEKGLASRS